MHSLGCGNNCLKISGFEGRSPHQTTIDIGLGQQLRGIGRVHAATVQDAHPLALPLCCGLDLRAQHGGWTFIPKYHIR